MAELSKRERKMARRIKALEEALQGVLRIVNEDRPIPYEEAEAIVFQAYAAMEMTPHRPWDWVH